MGKFRGEWCCVPSQLCSLEQLTWLMGRKSPRLWFPAGSWHSTAQPPNAKAGELCQVVLGARGWHCQRFGQRFQQTGRRVCSHTHLSISGHSPVAQAHPLCRTLPWRGCVCSPFLLPHLLNLAAGVESAGSKAPGQSLVATMPLCRARNGGVGGQCSGAHLKGLCEQQLCPCVGCKCFSS